VTEDESSKKRPPPQPDHLQLASYTERLHKFYLRKFGNRDVAKDMVQETFLRVIQRDKNAELVANPLSYLFKTLENTATRQAMREKGLGVVMDTDQLNATLDKDATNASVPPEEVVGAWQTFKRVFRSLPRPYRRILFLDRVRGFTDDEIAARLKFSAHTVRIYKTRARAFCYTAWKDRIK
jgi:RNA polymerase sigma factor (sigma-70 family)